MKIIADIETDKKKIVIIGRNGSGKSQLLYKIYKENRNNSVFIPAARSVHELNTDFDYTDESNNRVELNILNRTFVHRFDTLHISRLLSKDYAELDKSRRNQQLCGKDYVTCLNSILKRVSQNFTGINVKNFKLINADNYELKKASDGEKQTIVLICAVLSADDNAILLIDEPELGLHNAGAKELFDALEEERPDCTFVYATHNLDFAKTREDAAVLYISRKNSQQEAMLINHEDLEKDLLIDINGISKPILLVEGKETDKKLYSKIFRDYEVRNGDGCGQIKARVKAVRDFFKRQDIFGLLDGDDRSKEEIEELKTEGCFCIPYAQHEHLYILPEVLDMHLESLNKTDLLSQIILIDVIKKASDFSNHDAIAGQEIKKIAETITSEKILYFLKRYRGKDLVHKVANTLNISKSVLLNMAFKKEVIEKIKSHLAAQKIEILNHNL